MQTNEGNNYPELHFIIQRRTVARIVEAIIEKVNLMYLGHYLISIWLDIPTTIDSRSSWHISHLYRSYPLG